MDGGVVFFPAGAVLMAWHPAFYGAKCAVFGEGGMFPAAGRQSLRRSMFPAGAGAAAWGAARAARFKYTTHPPGIDFAGHKGVKIPGAFLLRGYDDALLKFQRTFLKGFGAPCFMKHFTTPRSGACRQCTAGGYPQRYP